MYSDKNRFQLKAAQELKNKLLEWKDGNRFPEPLLSNRRLFTSTPELFYNYKKKINSSSNQKTRNLDFIVEEVEAKCDGWNGKLKKYIYNTKMNEGILFTCKR